MHSTNEINSGDCFDLLLSVCTDGNTMRARYKQLREMLERICKQGMENESLQMTDLSARISFIAKKMGLSTIEQHRLHTFRLASNQILNRQSEGGTEEFLRDVKTLAFFVKKLTGAHIPSALYRLLPQADATFIAKPFGKFTAKRMRVCFQYADDQYLYVTPTDNPTPEPVKVRYNVPQVNDEFSETCTLLWPHAQLNLLDVSADDDGLLTPSFIVLEPDYLLDISTLAECFKDYGHHPLNYQFSKLQQMENTRHILLGNITNFFLDQWIFSSEEPDYMECMRQVFRRYPIELASCPDLADRDIEATFFADCKMHFNHLREIVNHTFPMKGYELDKSDAVLEPSYICEALGLQGRLDYMQRNHREFIEMKSGRADEFTVRNKVLPKENNRVQMLLYQAVLEYTLGIQHQTVTPYLLYTRYPLLYSASPSWAMVRRAINLRNRIVANEYSIQLHNSPEFTDKMLRAITPDRLNEKGLYNKLWLQYLAPGIEKFTSKLNALSQPERAYFLALFNFIAKEQYTAKSGDGAYEGRQGSSALWLSTLEEKLENGEILLDLTIAENNANLASKPFVVLERSATEDVDSTAAMPNFREGDAVVLYERNTDTDNATNKLLFKGNIVSLEEKAVTVRLRAPQHNLRVFNPNGLYAIEHDSMDTAFKTMYQGLAAFLSANQERKDLLLGKRIPQTDYISDEGIVSVQNDFERIASKAVAAKDMFLLQGPPGTGKTSRALRLMVEKFHSQPHCQLLLLAYTNRAVDEICKALTNISPAVEFIRVGNELSCDPTFRPYLIENVLANYSRRDEVARHIRECRIMVGTVATITGKPELFQLKHFDVAIVDESTQILEPQLLPLLCLKNRDDRNAIGKFVLIGDHKQLPAVVLQSAAQTEVTDEGLRAIGLTNLKDSLFERMHRTIHTLATDSTQTDALIDMLCRQGRMHPEVAQYANVNFYGNKLLSLGLPHQVEHAPHPFTQHTADKLMQHLCSNRLLFIPSEAERQGGSNKINQSEAEKAAEVAQKIYAIYQQDFDPQKTLGIITPYRSQIATIKREIARLNIAALNEILVDTVERFQGSERDVIIYSLSVNKGYQVDMLSNVTEENGVLIDRKLNVALTRARKQNVIIGVPHLLKRSPFYSKLLSLVKFG